MALLQSLSDPIQLDRVNFLYLHGRFNQLREINGLREMMSAEPRLTRDRQEDEARLIFDRQEDIVWIIELVSNRLQVEDTRFQTECWYVYLTLS